MKTLKFLSIMLCALLCAFSFTACGGDDDDNNEPTPTPTPTPTPDPTPTPSTYEDLIVGDWIVYYDDSYSENKVEITFTESGKYVAENSWMMSNGTWSDPFVYSGTYFINGDNITIIEKDDKAYFAGKLTIVSLTADKFTFIDEDNDVFRGEKVTSGNTGGGTTSNSIVGTWVYEDEYESITFIFKENGEGILIDVYSGSGPTETESIGFKYIYNTTEKELLIITDDGETLRLNATFYGNRAVIDGNTYNRE